MSKTEKSIEKWLADTPTDCPVNRVMAVLNSYFENSFALKGGSHITVTDKRLVGLDGFDALGNFTIPVKNGQTVKRYYLKRLAKAVEKVRSLEDE